MVSKVPAMKDMRVTEKEMAEKLSPTPMDQPIYPYGLCISLCEDELQKLDLHDEELEPGDMIHLHSLAKVTSVSSTDTENGCNCRVELTLCYISCEDEDEEDSEADKDMPKLYRKK